MKKILLILFLITSFFSLNAFSEDKKISCEFFQAGETESWRQDEFIFNTDDFKMDTPSATHNLFLYPREANIDRLKVKLDSAAAQLERGKQLHKSNHISDKALEDMQELNVLAKAQLEAAYVGVISSKAVNYSVTPTHIVFTIKRQMLSDQIQSINRKTLERHVASIESSSLCKISDFNKENLF
jgi:hypothetical protein